MKHVPILLLAVIFSACAPKVYDRLSWQKTEVQTDGNLAEWSNPLKYFDSKSKLNFSVTNDRQNLYICIKAADDGLQIKMLRGGLDFMIDTTAKKAFAIAVTYPLPKTERPKAHDAKRERNENQPENPGEETRNEQSEISRKQAAIENCKDMKLSGFSNIPITDNIPVVNPFGIKAGIAIDKNDVMVYELIIPFKTFYKEQLTPSDTSKVFSYQIKVRGIASLQPHVGGAAGGGGGRGGGGGGGGGMNGMGGGGMGAMGGSGMRGGSMGVNGGARASAINPLGETDVIQFKARFSYK